MITGITANAESEEEEEYNFTDYQKFSCLQLV